MKTKIIWIIYIAIVLFAAIYFVKISPRNEKEDINAEAPFGLYKDMITMIRRDNYYFDFDITSKDKKIKYKGKKDKDREDSEIFYDDKNGDVRDLEKYIDMDFINPNYLFDILEDNDYEVDNKNETRFFTYNINIKDMKTEIKVETDLDSITNIIIVNDEVMYDLKYENIGFTVIDNRK